MVLPKGIRGRVASLSDIGVIEDGSITINAIQTNNGVLYTGSQDDINAGVEVTVISIPADGPLYITKIACSGEDNGRWQLYIDSVLKSVKRTTDRNVEWDFPTPFKLEEGSTMDIKVISYGTGTTSDFNATVFGYTSNLSLQSETTAQWKFNET